MSYTAVQAGKVYRWQIIEAAIMKWVHLGFDKPGCVMGIVSRDANYLNTIPRLAESVVVVAANRWDTQYTAVHCSIPLGVCVISLCRPVDLITAGCIHYLP